MRRTLFVISLVIAVMGLSTGAASAGPAVQHLPRWEPDPGDLEDLGGHLDMNLRDRAVIVDLRAQEGGAVDRQFTVRLGESAGSLPSSFHADAARVVVWSGHLVVIADREKLVFHFSVAGLDPPAISNERHELPAFALAEAGPAPVAGYQMTRIADAKAILSKTPAGARSLAAHGIVPGSSFLMDCCATDYTCCTDYQSYGDSGGGLTCTSSCSTRCYGESCSASCAAGRCAQCSCNPTGPICYCY